MKLALLLPGYLDSPDYLHLKTFDKRLTELGYTVERLDLGNLWATGSSKDYTVTHFLDEIKERVNFYQTQTPEEIILIGHSRGAFTAIVAGNKIEEIDKVVALCPPPDFEASARKWVNQGSRITKRDLPDSPFEFREFSVPYAYIEDSMKYSAIESAELLHKPLMILIALNDEVVAPELTERIVAAANNPHVVRVPNLGHDFRKSQAECDLVMGKIEEFLSILTTISTNPSAS